MKKSVFKDYVKASQYFVDENEEVLKKEIESVEKTKNFFTWVQEFSKKIIVIAFIVYLINTIYTLVLVYLSYSQGMLTGLDTLISETNQTFREVIGGYLIKAALENVFKISGNYLVGISDARLNALRSNLEEKGIKVNGSENNQDQYSGFNNEEDFAG